MGGGRRRPFVNAEDLKTLGERVKKMLKSEADAQTHNVFLSFDSRDMDEVNLLRGQAQNENTELDFNDYSIKEPIDSEHAEYIKNQIREQMRHTSVTVVYVTEHTHESAWVNWEIEESIALGKGVVAMHKGDSPPSKLPDAVTKNDVRVVAWNHEALSEAIRQAASDRE